MRAIIIEDKDAKALIDGLRLTQTTVHNYTTVQHTAVRLKIPEDDVKKMADEIHRHFHYTVVKWLQDQGAHTL